MRHGQEADGQMMGGRQTYFDFMSSADIDKQS